MAAEKLVCLVHPCKLFRGPGAFKISDKAVLGFVGQGAAPRSGPLCRFEDQCRVEISYHESYWVSAGVGKF